MIRSDEPAYKEKTSDLISKMTFLETEINKLQLQNLNKIKNLEIQERINELEDQQNSYLEDIIILKGLFTELLEIQINEEAEQQDMINTDISLGCFLIEKIFMNEALIKIREFAKETVDFQIIEMNQVSRDLI